MTLDPDQIKRDRALKFGTVLADDARRLGRLEDLEAAYLAAEEHLVKRLEALQTYFDVDFLEIANLALMTSDEVADTKRQYRLITEALAAWKEATE